MSEIPVISIGEIRVTLFALLAGLLFLAAAAAVTVRLRRREWKTGPAVLFCLAAGLLGLVLGRGLFFMIRSEYFLDPMGQFVGLAPLVDFNLGGVTVVGVIPGVFLGGWIVCRTFGKNAAETFDAAAVPGLLLFAAILFIEPLSGQGYGPMMTQPAFCWPPLGIQNGWGDWLLSVCFVEGVLLLITTGITAGLRLPLPGSRSLCAAVLLSCAMIIPESLREDDVLRIFIFARVTQLGCCVMLVVSAMLIWYRSIRSGMGKGVLFWGALVLAVALLVTGEFALDRAEWPDGWIYLGMALILAVTAGMLLNRLIRSQRGNA